MKADKPSTEARSVTLDEVAAALQGATRVLAICHINPDGDAIGSLLGLAWVMRALRRPPEVLLACADSVPDLLRFLPGADAILREVPALPWDVVVALDASDAARLGPIFSPASYRHAPVIVLDHHVTNLQFGTLNHVDTSAAATAQIVVGLADALGVPISYNAAVCLLAGLVTDTLSFRTSNVTPQVLTSAARLMAAGADLSNIAQRCLYDRPQAILRLWGKALSQMHLDGGVLWTVISRDMRTEVGMTGSSENGLASQLINATEARVAAVFNEVEEQQVEVSLRARAGYEVASVALSLEGGGHPQAAGCLLPGSLAAVTARVLPLLAAVAAQPAPDRP